MRFALPLLALLAVPFAGTAHADPYRWCAEYGRGHGGINCGFVTLQQCHAALLGNGGFCRPNAFYDGRQDPRSRRSRGDVQRWSLERNQ
jgi:hypothetical protein